MPGRRRGRQVLAVADVIADEITEAHWRLSRGSGDALDGHALYTRLKIAAALALLDGRLLSGVTDEDWYLAGVLMTVSDRTRDAIRAELATQTSEAKRARAHRAADEAVTVDEARAAAATKRAGAAIVRKLVKRPGEWLTGTDLRRALSSDTRDRMAEALEALELAGQIEVQQVEYRGQAGHRYRSRT